MGLRLGTVPFGTFMCMPLIRRAVSGIIAIIIVGGAFRVTWSLLLVYEEKWGSQSYE